jgi:hypothetical protein
VKLSPNGWKHATQCWRHTPMRRPAGTGFDDSLRKPAGSRLNCWCRATRPGGSPRISQAVGPVVQIKRAPTA